MEIGADLKNLEIDLFSPSFMRTMYGVQQVV
jgi:hypothetical protein